MRKLLAVLSIFLLAVILAPAARSADTLEEVRKKGVLVVGVKEAFPPFGFRDRAGGEIVGIDVELAAAIARKIGVPLKLLPVTPAERVPSLLDGKVDLVAAAMSKTPDRAKLVDFSLTYFTTRQRILAKTGSIVTVKDLEGKKIGALEGSASEAYLKTGVPSAAVYTFSDYRFAIDALRKGAIEAVSMEGVILNGVLPSLPKDAYEIPRGIALSDESYGLAVRKGDAKFLEFVNATLTELNKSGEGNKIFEKWLTRRDAGAAASAPPAEPRAGGVITRPTPTHGRFIAMGVRGVFTPDAEIGFYTPQGDFICTGKVLSIYGDEVYVDASCAPQDSIQPGFPVAMGLSKDEAKKIIAERQEVLQKVKDESQKESEQRQKEIASEHRKEEAERKKYQEQVTQQKMLLDYQYDDRNYYWGGYRNW
jgi:polar amino acid transport system substrate-binding protein